MAAVLVGSKQDLVGIDLEHQRLLLSEPAVRKAGWLPQGLWPELDEFAERHDDAIAGLESAIADASALGDKFRAEDEERVDAYKTGLKTPSMTDPAEREQAAADAKAKVEAARRELAEAVGAAVEGVQAHADEWLADLDDQRVRREGEARAGREPAGGVARRDRAGEATEHWVERTASNSSHLAHSEVPVGVPKPPPNLAQILGMPQSEYVEED